MVKLGLPLAKDTPGLPLEVFHWVDNGGAHLAVLVIAIVGIPDVDSTPCWAGRSFLECSTNDPAFFLQRAPRIGAGKGYKLVRTTEREKKRKCCLTEVKTG